MKIETITVGAFEVNCYLVRRDTNEWLVIDPGAEADLIKTALERCGAQVAAYLLTHGHVDHISALPALLTTHPAPVYIHPADATWAFTPRNQIPPFYEVPSKPAGDFRYVSDGRDYSIRDYAFHVIETPGHTPGGVCYYFPNENVLFSGDTLFHGSVGRTDLPGGSAKILTQSLRKLAALPDITRVYPGHGRTTTMAAEKSHNLFLRSAL